MEPLVTGSRRPRFTVVMPAHNARETVGASILSVLRQTHVDYELVVVDDGSTDATGEIARTFARRDSRIRVIEQENRGPAAARNLAISRARGDLVSMIDSDDLWLPRYLQTMGATLATAPSAGFAYTDAWVLMGSTGLIRRKTAMALERPPATPPRDPKRFLELLLERNFVFTAATVRRTVLEEVGGYDERFWFGEDFDLWLRILEAGHGAVRVPTALAIHRESDNSLTSDLHRNILGICKIYATVVEEHELDDRLQAIAVRRRDWWKRRLQAHENPSHAQAIWFKIQTLVRRLLWRWKLKDPPPEVADTLAACGAATLAPFKN